MSIVIGLFILVILLFTYNGFEKLLKKITGRNLKPGVIWLTGLSGSGKTTIAKNLAQHLKKQSRKAVLLDGDEIRHLFNHHEFTEEARKKHNLNVGYISSLLEKQGNIVIVSLISPYAEIRDAVRNICTNFIEVYVATSLEVCIQRDPKGLYKKAMAGEIKDFTGISAPYHPPLNAELIVDASKMSADDCARMILGFCSGKRD